MDGEKEAVPDIPAEAIVEERRRLRRVRLLVDMTCALLYQIDGSELEARRLVEATRRKVLDLFPGKEETFELIYRPRFERILKERYGPYN